MPREPEPTSECGSAVGSLHAMDARRDSAGFVNLPLVSKPLGPLSPVGALPVGPTVFAVTLTVVDPKGWAVTPKPSLLIDVARPMASLYVVFLAA